MNKRTITIVITVIAAVILVVAGILVSKKTTKHNPIEEDPGTTLTSGENSGEKNLPTTYIDGEKTVGSLVIKDVKIVLEEENQCTLEAQVINSGDEVSEPKILDIELLNESGDSIGITQAGLAQIEANTAVKIAIPIGVDVLHTRDVKVTIEE